MDETEAIQRLRHGDIAALETLVRRYQVQAARAAYLVVRDRALAQDVVQSAFARLHERLGRFDQQRPFAPWFLRLVLNDAIKMAVRRSREVGLDDGGDGDPGAVGLRIAVDPGVGPERAWEQAETADEVWAALARLAPVQRAAVVQRYYLGLSEAEMAARLDCPPSTIKSRLHAARNRLRLLLRPTAPDLETTR
jgi:RNA polymerase sigma-70 factor (ECF subfamily)